MLKIFKHITKESGSKRFSDRGVYETVVLGLLLAGIATMMTVAGSVGQKISGHVRVKNAKNDLAAIGTLSGLGMQYYMATGNAPTVNDLVSAGYLPASAAVCSSCNGGQGAYVTRTHSQISLGAPTVPGEMIGVNVQVSRRQGPVAAMYQNALSGATMSSGANGTYEIAWNNPVSGSLSGRYVELHPANPNELQQVKSALYAQADNPGAVPQVDNQTGVMDVHGDLTIHRGTPTGYNNGLNGPIGISTPRISPPVGHAHIDMSNAILANVGAVQTNLLQSLTIVEPGNWYQPGAPQTGTSGVLCLAPYTYQGFGWGYHQSGAGGSGGGESYWGNYGYAIIQCP